MAQFFIGRPVFSAVISIVIVLLGLIAMFQLPVDQYPYITPPQVSISASYPGAASTTAAESVATPLEQQVNGVPNMIYMSSKSTNSGSTNVTITFDVGTSPDLAAVDVQNATQQAIDSLPIDVQTAGVSVSKDSSVELLKLSLTSKDPRFDEIYLSNYASINIESALRRIPGVGRVRNTGARSYAMRVWLRPDALAGHSLTTTDVIDAIKAQNKETPAGTVGTQPNTSALSQTLPITASGRLSSVREFEEIIVRANPDGSLIRLRDIARVELGSSAYTLQSQLNGENATILQVYLLPGANALEVTRKVKETMAELATKFPSGMDWQVFYDASVFIEESIDEVVQTLIEALVLVVLVVYLFLQNLRATLIPAIAVPVSLIGTLAAMLAFGFTINTVSLLALVLAIGIVVDDAIVVVENVERLINEKGMSPMAATRSAMKELSGALIATSLVLCAVFVPVSFLAGITGIMYREFAVAIAVAVLISTVVALTLSPALCALLLRPGDAAKSGFFFWLNNRLSKLTDKYVSLVGIANKHARRSYLVFGAMVVAVWYIMSHLPSSFMPDEDQGRFFIDMTLPAGATVNRTQKVLKIAERHVLAHPAVAWSFTLAGENRRSGSNQANGQFEVVLKPWAEREQSQATVQKVMKELKHELSQVLQAEFNLYLPSAVPGLGNGSGVEMVLQDTSGTNFKGLMETSNELVEQLKQQPEVAAAAMSLQGSIPQMYLSVNEAKAMAIGVDVADLYSTIKTFTDSSVVNDFNLFGRVYKVRVQAEDSYRQFPQQIKDYYVRSPNGVMVPIGVLADYEYTVGPAAVTHYNLFSSASINVTPAAGYASGDVIKAINRVAKPMLPPEFKYEWTGLTFQEVRSANQTSIAITLALVFVFLFLAALYESWTIPVAVLLIAPVAMLGASLATLLSGMQSNLFFQVAFIALIGMAAKNSILIVEFANQLHREGRSRLEAAMEAAAMRFRPILMTSMAFILGVLPLVLSAGPGSVSRHSVSIPILGGMVLATSIGIILVPLFFVTIAGWVRAKVKGDSASQKPATEEGL
ncbi:TPA: multidrug efflux RND transporter permease subunit [Shewanella algae]|uniref:efflux RND transporter permease subunit n=1 Tax=Shewanella algae TaxID=38313 RepID=UPI000D658FD9|nr:multidrug efflux RND transporter permease subunit [Shewanella algae]PWF92453.1 multidrug efflux RND transporter permease subunit [Shewanella algae]HDS1205774.1 multidrug efflux RND transporter permease subunit [Shewanella algae]HDS1209382.1 multidrug efflux RND transporter permease subunit [Shewanella algae]